jgi:hypothetical protein
MARVEVGVKKQRKKKDFSRIGNNSGEQCTQIKPPELKAASEVLAVLDWSDSSSEKRLESRREAITGRGGELRLLEEGSIRFDPD